MLFRTFLSPVAGALLALGLCSGAVAQSPYPNKPVKLMVALPAGGSADMIARVVSQKLGEQLGQFFLGPKPPRGPPPKPAPPPPRAPPPTATHSPSLRLLS